MAELPVFDVGEMVLVLSTNPKLEQVNGKVGAILDRWLVADGDWCYTVHLSGNVEYCDVSEADLIATGEIDPNGAYLIELSQEDASDDD